jgi:hypothetical protein
MRRTQIQLDEDTYSTVKRLAYERGRSFSFIIRETLGRSLGTGARKRREKIGRFPFVGSGRSDQRGVSPVSERHDDALAHALMTKRGR